MIHQSYPRRFALALAAWLATTVLVLVTGWQVCRFYGAGPWTQSALLQHMIWGVALAPLLAWLLAVHPFRSADISPWRTVLGMVAGGAAAALGAVAIGTGLALPVNGNLSTTPQVAGVHMLAADLFAAFLLVHLVHAFALRSSMTRRTRALSLPAGLSLLLCLVGVTFVTATAVPTNPDRKPVPAGYKLAGGTPKTIFTPGRERTSHGELIPVGALSGSLSCGVSGCHEQITHEWSSSMHRFAASNDHYRAQVKLRIQDVPVKPYMGARFCSACHEPIAVLAGEVDPGGRGLDFPENLQEGISCLSCHRMTDVVDGRGNGSYEISPPHHYPYQGREGLGGDLARAAIRAKPEAHRLDMMRPLLHNPLACAPCHRLTIGPGIIKTGQVLVQETYEEYQHTNFYRPTDPADRRRCQDCHMPLVASHDPAAKEGRHHSHRFLGANTMRPWLDGDTEQLELTQRFLQDGAVTLSVEPQGPAAAGRPLRVDVGVTNRKVGHRFPTGTVDMHDLWIELIATGADGRQIYASGLVDAATQEVDPGAQAFKSIPMDSQGRWLYRRDMWNFDHFKMRPNPAGDLEPARFGYFNLGLRLDLFNLPSLSFMRTVWPGTTDTSTYLVPVPAGLRGSVTLAARLRYRKANQRFTNWVFDPRPLREGSAYAGPRKMGVSMPITDVARATATAVVSPSP